MRSVAIVVPVLGRPQNVEPLVASIEQSMASDEPFRILFVADKHDKKEIEAVRAVFPRASLMLCNGSYAHKINHGILATEDPYIFAAADDLDFRFGWYSAAIKEFERNPKVGVVGTQDLGHKLVKRGEHATHPLVARWYVEQHGTIDQPGLLYHEGYHHVCCDIEMVETAKMRGAWAFAHEAVVEHLHWNWGKGDDDDTYKKGRARRREDKALLHSREALWGAAA